MSQKLNVKKTESPSKSDNKEKSKTPIKEKKQE